MAKAFPRGLKGDEIPLMARIIAVAGVYDTILRGWLGDPLPKTEALRQLEKEAGTTAGPGDRPGIRRNDGEGGNT